MIQIEPVAKRVYCFRASKRWQRTGWTWDRQPTNERYFRQHEREIRWIDSSPEEASEAANLADYKRILEEQMRG
jgi:hypothetical protein